MNIIIDVMNLQEKQLRHYYRKNKITSRFSQIVLRCILVYKHKNDYFYG